MEGSKNNNNSGSSSKGKEMSTVGRIGYMKAVPMYETTVMAPAAPKHERTRVAWEDKNSGDFFRRNTSEKITETDCRRYENVTYGNKFTGYQTKFYAEEKFPINNDYNSNNYGNYGVNGGSSNNYSGNGGSSSSSISYKGNNHNNNKYHDYYYY